MLQNLALRLARTLPADWKKFVHPILYRTLYRDKSRWTLFSPAPTVDTSVKTGSTGTPKVDPSRKS